MPPIRLLPDTLRDQIAAGEVIERPAAALKELVENAIDAGARRIDATLEDGGIGRIEVIDDGYGMAPHDLALAVQRHATSKLSDDTLVRIATLGFRGEALPAIGSAARLELISRTADAEHAWSIQVAGGAVGEAAPCAGAPGTRVVVRDLFYATPARRKFLKQPRTEADHAEAALRRLALAHPHIAMRLRIDDRIALDLPAQDRAARVAALLGPEAAAVLLPIEAIRGALHLSGFIGAAGLHRPTGAAQYLVVNGRPVTDPVLKTAVRVGYRDVIVAHRHAVVALYLDMPAEAVDVNVHPAKTELRFAEPAEIRSLVIGAITRALGVGAGTRSAPPPVSGFTPIHAPLRAPVRAAIPPDGPRFTGFAEAQLPIGLPPAARQIAAAVPAPEHPLGAAVAQVLDTYVIAIAADGSLVLVDQHAAHERLTQEAIRAQWQAGGVRTQLLLLPAVVDLPPAAARHLADHADALAALGMAIEPFGPGAILVRALPAALGAPDPAPLLRDIAEELAECEATTTLDARLDAVIARLACHGSIRAGRRLGTEEMNTLLRAMEATPRAATCSHGRPTFLRLTRAEIERMFGRS